MVHACNTHTHTHTLVLSEELKQYPGLWVEVESAAVGSLERLKEESKKATLQLVDMECGLWPLTSFATYLEVDESDNPEHSLFDRYNDSYIWRIGTTVLSYVNMVSASLRHSILKSIVYCQVREAKRGLHGHFFTELGKMEPKRASSLLNEDPAIMERRCGLSLRLDLYRSAQAEIDAVVWSKKDYFVICLREMYRPRAYKCYVFS